MAKLSLVDHWAVKLLETEAGLVPNDVRVDGEVFLVNDDKPIPFWEFCRIIWRQAGDDTKFEEVIIIPAWLALRVAFIIEWSFKIFTLGKVQPPIEASRLAIRSTMYNYTYSIEKARKRLGFNSVGDHEENLKLSMKWELKSNPEKWKDLKPR